MILFRYFLMITTPSNWPEIENITPEKIQKYLQNKTNFLRKWNILVPGYFDKQQFCDYLNILRKKLITNKDLPENQLLHQKIKQLQQKKPLTIWEKNTLEALKLEKKNKYYTTINEVFRISKNQNSDIKNIYPLIGSLLSVVKSTKEKIQDFTEIVNDDLNDILSYMGAYKEEILIIRDDLVDQFFTNQGIGSSVSEDEKKQFTTHAWEMFINRHKEEIDQWIIDIEKLRTYINL